MNTNTIDPNSVSDNSTNACDCDLTVYFNTGFKYPIGNSFVGQFGGTSDGHMDMCEITWRTKDAPALLQTLQNFQQPLPDFEQVEKSTQGTEFLYTSLSSYGYTAFRFGCILYHQLQYKRKLTALFQTGRCHMENCWHSFVDRI